LLAEAEAFENAQELIDFLGSDVTISKDDSLFAVVGSDCVVRFVVVGRRFRKRVDKTADWASVQRLKIVEISR
jgi:hypothetical protein